MRATPLELKGLYIFEPTRHTDSRGYFSESFRADKFAATTGRNHSFVQDNTALSRKAGTVRALHCQAPPHAQGKLVTCLTGSITDIVVDIRKSSPDYGRHVAVELSAETAAQLWVPEGFLHGYITRKDHTLVSYKVTDYYAPDCEHNVQWNDANLNIEWGVSPAHAHVSDKDAAGLLFSDFHSPFA